MADQRRGDRWLNAARVIGLVTLVGGLMLLAVVIFTQSVEKANSWAGVLGTSLAIVGGIVTILTSWWRQRAAAIAPVTPEVLAQAAKLLASRVAEQWQREAEARSLNDPDPMPVRWTLSDDALMDHEEHIAPAPVVFTGCSDRTPELVGEFRKLHRRRLVIVGGPGTGKTTLAVQLVLQLLADPWPGDPVPVLLSMVSWDPDAQPRVQDWLTDQLNQTYPALRAFGRDAARRLVEQGRVLPVLDGLDELPERRRPRVITALNASLPRDGGVILTSRIDEYSGAVGSSDVLTAAAVVRPEPLTNGEVADYLVARLPRRPDPSWQTVLTALREGAPGALSTVASTPLGLWLLRTVHIDARHDPEALIDVDQYPDPQSIQTHLLAELIPAVLRSRPPRTGDEDPLRPKRLHHAVDVRRGLTSLAIELRDAGSRVWLWWHLS
ncbi:MAG: NACHT domain-containing protein, partial [Actinomycetota bacterium]|nr:NACHT domain-containing protein [Actinomycetota bacterium]